MTPDEVAKKVLDLMNQDPTGEKARAFIESKQGSWDTKTLVAMFEATKELAGAAGGRPLFDTLQQVFPPTTSAGKRIAAVGVEPGALNRAADKAYANAQTGGQGSADLDGDGKVDSTEREAFDQAGQRWAANQVRAGQNPADVAEQVQSVADSVYDQVRFPDWVLAENGGVPPDEGLIQMMIQTWNEQNPDQPISDAATLAQRLQNPNSPMASNLIDSVFLGLDPIMDYRITLRGGKTVTIQAEQFAAAQKRFQGDFSAEELTNAVRWANNIGMVDENGNVQWQIIAAIMKAKGATDDFGVTHYKSKNPHEQDNPDALTTRISGGADPRMIQQAGVTFKSALATYGNVGIAYLMALNPTLATKLATTKSDQWTPQEIRMANQYMLDGGILTADSPLSEMGFADTTAGTLMDLGTSQNGGRAGAAGPTRQMPDPEALRQSAKDLYKGMFLADPTDQQLSEFVSKVQGIMMGAPDDQQVDGGAQLRKLLESDTLYKELYGKMPGGMTESEWQGQFRAGAASMLGGEAPDPNVLRGGMRSGKYQTTVGAAFGSKKGWGNSTLQQRLAIAAQTVSENT